ncbi:YVTN family beta-propeller protein [Chitinophaga niastensis]|uniref:YVTN family beta-propeller protein n=1 Tax=Chitinophaga niastensis TaxID=536980 RepID=A0A2P8HJ20_CHINA|nr:YncE family protein [Chitinophaga niastensis]PSL46202.1 YVTN family beta-propeller protein [Chitinophaga niastensis]
MKKILLAAALLTTYAVNAQSKYHVAKTFAIASDGKWDYIALNPVTQQLYVSHGTQVNVLDKSSGDSTGVILNTTGVHGVAFAEKFNKGYTSNGKINTTTVFDIKTNKVLGEIKTGTNPDAIMYDPFSEKIITCNGGSSDLSVIDPATDKVVATIALGGRPETAVTDGKGNIYVNLEDKSQVVAVNAKTFQAGEHFSLGKGEAPTGLAIDVATNRLFAGCDNKLLVVLNAANGKIVTTLPIGDGCDGVAFDAGEKTIFASNGEGTLSVIREESADKYTNIATVPTRKGAKTLVVDPLTHHVYLPVADRLPAVGTAKPQIATGTFKVLQVSK